MHLPQIAAIPRVADEAPEPGRFAQDTASGAAFQSVFSGNETEEAGSDTRALTHQPGRTEPAGVDASEFTDSSNMTLLDVPTAVNADAPQTDDPVSSLGALGSHDISPDDARAGANWGVARAGDGRGAEADNLSWNFVPQPSAGARGAPSTVNPAPTPGGVADSGRLAETDLHDSRRSMPQHGRVDDTASTRPDTRPLDAPLLPVRAVAARTENAVVQAAGTPNNVLHNGPPIGGAETLVGTDPVPTVERSGVAANAVSSALATGRQADIGPGASPAGARLGTRTVRVSDIPEGPVGTAGFGQNKSGSAAMPLSHDVPGPTPASGRDVAHGAPAPAGVQSVGGQLATADGHVAQPPADLRVESRERPPRRVDPGSRDEPMTARPAGATLDTGSGVARHSALAPQGVPVAEPGGATIAANTFAPAAGDGGSGADARALDAGLGELRVAASPSSQAAPPILQAPETPRAVVLQIVEILRASGERAVELRLQPEELGRLQLTMSQDASGTLTVSLYAERGETLDLLRRNIDLLAAELRALGYENLDFSFHGDGANDEEAPGAAREDGSAGVGPTDRTTDAGDPAYSGTGRPGVSRDGIDIRL